MAKKRMKISKKLFPSAAMIVVLTCGALVTNAQYNITAMLPSGSIYMRSQLWLLSVANTGRYYVQAKMQFELKDIDTRQTVLTGVSGLFTLPPGVKNIDAKALEPVQYNTSTGIAGASPNSFIPPGRYRLCYQLYVTAGETVVPAADDCEQIEVEPLSPPLLTMPENDSLVTVATPNFTWSPPAPAAMFSNLNYSFQLAELYDGQSVNDAMQKNLPLQQSQGIQQPFFTYPLQGPQLVAGKKYVWQIIAKDQQRFAARSEVWMFKMGETKKITVNTNGVYLLMDEHVIGSAYIDAGMLHIKYISKTAAQQAPFIIKDEKGSALTTIQLAIKQGDNFLDIPLNGRFASGQKYTVQVTDTNGISSSITFTIK